MDVLTESSYPNNNKHLVYPVLEDNNHDITVRVLAYDLDADHYKRSAINLNEFFAQYPPQTTVLLNNDVETLRYFPQYFLLKVYGTPPYNLERFRQVLFLQSKKTKEIGVGVMRNTLLLDMKDGLYTQRGYKVPEQDLLTRFNSNDPLNNNLIVGLSRVYGPKYTWVVSRSAYKRLKTLFYSSEDEHWKHHIIYVKESVITLPRHIVLSMIQCLPAYNEKSDDEIARECQIPDGRYINFNEDKGYFVPYSPYF